MAAARAKVTTLRISLATERLNTIQGLLAYPQDAGQEQYCIDVVDHFRALGYTGLTKATVLVFFTEADRHAALGWTQPGGYTYKVLRQRPARQRVQAGPDVDPACRQPH